ncbi:GTPase IMAP family member 8-like [Salvelinus fontinalis]|uniref:GTPase IMAP family member 8-like n=1 Tax=Salvelinus fontinalis TaxID=8038 RepID=UPI0024865463|nr:GTPase IMAP family member 8-like [Salvelinus fontinalis]
MADIFAALNHLNQKMQGGGVNIIEAEENLKAFQKNLPLWKRRTEIDNFANFPLLDDCVSKIEDVSGIGDISVPAELKQAIATHLDELAKSLDGYFPTRDLKSKGPEVVVVFMLVSESPTELRIVLLGKNGSEKSAVGNLILEREAFDLNCVQNHCERARGQVEGRHIAVINTPDLLDPHISHDKLSEELRWCVTLSKPGPHVFLLVLQPEEFTQEEGDRIRTILDTLSDRSFDYSMVLTTHEDKRGHMDEDHPLNQMVRACRGRQHLSDHTQLMADVDKIVKENGGDHLTCDVFENTSGMVQGKEEIHRSKTDGSLKSSSEEKLGKEQVSSLRIVLLGKSDDKKTTVGNMILQRKAFFNYKQQWESASGKVNGKSVTVVKTPDFFAPRLTAESLMEEMENCKSLSAPGPHGVLLVLKPEGFTEENRNTFKLILSIFGKESFKHSMVIITHSKGATVNPHLRQMIEECRGRHHKMYTQGKELTIKIEEMVEENEWRYLTYNEETTHDTMTPKAQRLNVVLCGRIGAGKTSIANVILGQTESSPKSSSSSVCVKREGEVCGRSVTLIELPALYGTHLTQEEVMHRGELETIQKILSSRVNDFIMVLFRQDNIAVDFVEKNADTKQLIKICGGRYKIFDALKIDKAKQTTELVAEIVKMMDQNRTCYTLYMYMEAKHQSELDKNRRIKDLEERIRNMSQGAEIECSSTEYIRVVLIGKTGNGKSASANTILGRKEFASKSSTDSVTTVCKKAVGKVDGITVSVVDTPGLFDTTLSNKDVQQEIVKCVSLSAPGPHVFIIVLSIGRITQEELDTLDLIEKTFGPRAGMFCLVLFTRGDDLENESIQDYIGNSKNAKLKKLIRDCGDRFHVFNNRDKNRTQVTELLKKINKMVSMNKGSFYTNEMFQEAEAAIKQKQEAILKEREMEIKADMEKLKVSHETDMEKMKSKLDEERLKVQEERQLREKLLREREEAIRKEHEDKEKAEKEERELEDKKRKEDEKLKKEIWDSEKEKMEIKLKNLQREKEEEYKMRMDKLRIEEKDREEQLQNQERKFAKLKREQEEEIRRREKEEDETRKKEEKVRQEWQSKIEEAEKGQTELQEVMCREKEEWEEQLKKERDRQQEEERLRQKEGVRENLQHPYFLQLWLQITS